MRPPSSLWMEGLLSPAFFLLWICVLCELFDLRSAAVCGIWTKMPKSRIFVGSFLFSERGHPGAPIGPVLCCIPGIALPWIWSLYIHTLPTLLFKVESYRAAQCHRVDGRRYYCFTHQPVKIEHTFSKSWKGLPRVQRQSPQHIVV